MVHGLVPAGNREARSRPFGPAGRTLVTATFNVTRGFRGRAVIRVKAGPGNRPRIVLQIRKRLLNPRAVTTQTFTRTTNTRKTGR